MYKDTVVAPVTPPGEGGVAIIRLSGPRAEICLDQVFSPRRACLPLTSHHLTLGTLRTPEGDLLDQVMAVVMRAPHSYTGEDVVEVHCHGAPVTVRHILDTFLRMGLRLAGPGEFTLRAFLNGRLDLAQAEAVADLIRSRSERATRVALGQLDGVLSRTIQSLRHPLLETLALLEAYIDFPEEDLPDEDAGKILAPVRQCLSRSEVLSATFDQGRILREGLSVLILGRPNVGKSSLLNALLGEARAIVTPVAGTTRDLIEEQITLAGIPVRLIDTAGIRPSHDPVEQEGVRRARSKIDTADLVLLVIDGSCPLGAEDHAALALCSGVPTIVVRNKSDLGLAPLDAAIDNPARLDLSVHSGQGLEALKEAITRACLGEGRTSEESVVLCERRHLEALLLCAESLRRFLAGWGSLSTELLALELRSALDSLGLITGETTPDEILDAIFSRFCIGK